MIPRVGLLQVIETRDQTIDTAIANVCLVSTLNLGFNQVLTFVLSSVMDQ